MKTTSLQLLPATNQGSASGNYDGTATSFNGDAVKAAGYYSSRGTLQTVAFFTTDLLATITIQATVDSTVTESSWFDVHTIAGDGSSVTNDNEVANLTGRYTWMRVKVTNFTQGVIDKVNVSY